MYSLQVGFQNWAESGYHSYVLYLFSSCNLINHCLDFGGYIAQADNHPVKQISLIQPVRIVRKMNLRNRGSSMHLALTVMIPYFLVGVLCLWARLVGEFFGKIVL